MQYICYRDILGELKKLLKPIDLYRLSLTCKEYRKVISMQDIKESTKNEIYRRLDKIFSIIVDNRKN
uniref:F-box domain-containing protein n=1 Tax=viral metagenome TaxID=1070528 RepID=A0A6C0C9S5_9ZZZZ